MSALSDARMAMLDANAAALRALDEARHDVAGGRETRAMRDLLSAGIRLQSVSTHIVAMILQMADRNAAPGRKEGSP
jgi:hypothetical protein